MRARKLSRQLDHRISLLRNLATSVVLYEKVITTTAKAKEIRSVVEKWINIGKGGGLTQLRRLLAIVQDPKAAKKIMEELAPRYRHVTGGYVVLTPTLPRLGDSAAQSIVEFSGVSTSNLPPATENRSKGAAKVKPTPRKATKLTKRSKKARK